MNLGKGRAKQTAWAKPIAALYHAIFQHIPLPGAGANEFAWETLQLPRISPIGAGSQVLNPLVETQTPMYAAQMVVPTGMFAIAGQFVSAPLFDPNSPGTGYVNPILESYA
jgi:hypothetical protein